MLLKALEAAAVLMLLAIIGGIIFGTLVLAVCGIIWTYEILKNIRGGRK